MDLKLVILTGNNKKQTFGQWTQSFKATSSVQQHEQTQQPVSSDGSFYQYQSNDPQEYSNLSRSDQYQNMGAVSTHSDTTSTYSAMPPVSDHLKDSQPQSNSGSYPVIRFNIHDPTRRHGIQQHNPQLWRQSPGHGRGRGGLGQMRSGRWDNVPNYNQGTYQQPPQGQIHSQNPQQTQLTQIQQPQASTEKSTAQMLPQPQISAAAAAVAAAAAASYQRQLSNNQQKQQLPFQGAYGQHPPIQHQRDQAAHQQYFGDSAFRQGAQQQFVKSTSEMPPKLDEAATLTDQKNTTHQGGGRAQKASLNDRDCWPEPLK